MKSYSWFSYGYSLGQGYASSQRCTIPDMGYFLQETLYVLLPRLRLTQHLP